MSQDTSQTQSTSTLFNFFNIFDKLKFKKKSKRKTSGLIENISENNETDTKNDKIGYDSKDINGAPKKSDRKGLKANKDNGDTVLKDMLITKIENYEDIEKFIANNSLKEEGHIICETIPIKTFEKDNKPSDFIVVHQKKQKSKKKVDNGEILAKDEQANESIELKEKSEKQPDLNSCELGGNSNNKKDDDDNNNNNNSNNNNHNYSSNNANSNLFRDFNDVKTEKYETKKHKDNKKLKCEYNAENCNVVELNRGVLNQLKTLPINFNEKQLLFLEGKQIKKVVDHNKAINKRSNTLKQKKFKQTNSQSKFMKSIRSENTTFNISKSLIITDSGTENQKKQIQELSAFSVDNVNSLREKAITKKKKRRKILNTYHDLTKPRSNLIVAENTEDKNMLKSNVNPSVSEKVEVNSRQETAYLDSVPVRDSKDSSIDQCNVGSGKDSHIIRPSSGVSHKVLEHRIHNNRPKARIVLEKGVGNKHGVCTDKKTRERRAYSTKEGFPDTAKEETIGIEVNFDDKPNERYNFFIESKNCSSTARHEMNNTVFPHDSIRNKLNALKTTAFKKKVINKPFQEDSSYNSNLPHIKKPNEDLNECNDYNLKKVKSMTFNKPTTKSAQTDHVNKQKRLPYTVVKKSFIPDMVNKEYISVANIRAPFKFNNGSQNEAPKQHETKFKINGGQPTNEAKVNSSPRESMLKENNYKNCNIFKSHTNFHGDCFGDKEMKTNEEDCKLRFNKNRENIKIRDKGDCVPDEREIFSNQFNMFLKIIKNIKTGNAESVESIINDTDFFSKCLKLFNSENYIRPNRDEFIRIIGNTEIDNWKSYSLDSVENKTKHVDISQKNSKFLNSEDYNVRSRDYFARVDERTESKHQESTEINSMPADSLQKLSNVLNHKHISMPDRNNFVQIVKSSEHCNNSENRTKQCSNKILKNNNTGASVPTRIRTLTYENKTSCTENHPNLSVNFVNISKNKVINSDTDHSEVCYNEKYNVSTGEVQMLSDNGKLNRKVSNGKSSHHSHQFSDSDYKFRNNFILTDFSSIKKHMDSYENDINTNDHNFNCYQPDTCEVNEDTSNRKFEQLYVVKHDVSNKNSLKDSGQKINMLRKIKDSRKYGHTEDFNTQYNSKSVQNCSAVGNKNLLKSLSDSNLSIRSLSTEKIILKDSDYSVPMLCKTKFKKQQTIISKDMGINTDVYTTESEYLFNKCISVLTEHLSKIYALCDKQTCSGNDSGNESCNDNVNFKKKENGSGCSLCRDNYTSGHLKLPCRQQCGDGCHKASEEMYNLLLLMLTNNLNLSEMSERNGKKDDAFINNLRDVVCQYTEKRFKDLNKSIAELSKKVSETVNKLSNESVRTSNVNNDSKPIKHNVLQNQPHHSAFEVEHKTSEILELMKVIENTDININGCTDLSFVESKDYKSNCEISANKSYMDSKNVMHFQVEVQMNDTMQVDKIVIEGS